MFDLEAEKASLMGSENLEPKLRTNFYKPGRHRSTRWREFLSIVASRLYFSQNTSYVYGLTIFLNVIILIWSLQIRRPDMWFVFAESFVTMMLVIEVFLRFFMLGWSYFNHFSNVFDSILMGSCVMLLYMSLDTVRKRTEEEEVEDVLAQSLMILRFCIRLLRLVTFTLHARRSQLSKEDEVVFDQYGNDAF
eukprot:Platyproteum_vivax@DN14776_c0_g1_i1.p1